MSLQQKSNCYDIIIVGMGPAGIFTAYKAITENKNLNILMIDKGKDIYKRVCPMRVKQGLACVNCKPYCNIMSGFGGAGTFSDCKLSLTPFGVGGNITDYISDEKALELIKEVDSVYAKFDNNSDNRKIYGELSENTTVREIKQNCEDLDITFTECPTKHLGTDGTLIVMQNMYNFLRKSGIQFLFNTEVIDLDVKENSDDYKYIKTIDISTQKELNYEAKNVVLAPGRSGNIWLNNLMQKLHIDTKNDKIDLGVRVETKKEIVKYLTDNLYDMKLSWVDPETKLKVRTFCTNPGGYVSEEHYGNLAVANGHSFANKKSENSNFALLVTLNDKDITDNIQDYIKNLKLYIDSIKNEIKPIVRQNFVDFLLSEDYNFIFPSKDDIEPTLNSTVGNIDLPFNVHKTISDFIIKLSQLCPDIASNRTILYGIEIKFYSNTINVDSNFETKIKGLFCIGDGAGITRGITQAASTGIVVAEKIVK